MVSSIFGIYTSKENWHIVRKIIETGKLVATRRKASRIVYCVKAQKVAGVWLIPTSWW